MSEFTTLLKIEKKSFANILSIGIWLMIMIKNHKNVDTYKFIIYNKNNTDLHIYKY